MLGIIKGIMTLGGTLAGYKTYIGAFFLMTGTLAGWGAEVVMPWLEGDMGILDMIKMSMPHFAAMGVALGLAGLRKSNE
mgnify:CR=1 FL=1|jgi:hypothetical protein